MKLIFVCFLVVFLSSNLAKEQESEEILHREIEIGFRPWIGYHAKDRFEAQLGNYRSNSSINSFRFGNLTPMRENSGLEVFAKYRIYTNWKAGLTFGTGKFNTFEWREYDSLEQTTFLSYTLGSDYLLVTACYEWFFQNFSVELGGGLGANTTALEIRGYNYTNLGNLFNIKSNFIGSGLSYRLYSNFNFPLSKNSSLQLGIAGTWHSLPYFGGNWNERGGTLVLREDGSIAGINLDSNQNMLASQNAIRRLDMFYGYLQIHLGGMWRIKF